MNSREPEKCASVLSACSFTGEDEEAEEEEMAEVVQPPEAATPSEVSGQGVTVAVGAAVAEDTPNFPMSRGLELRLAGKHHVFWTGFRYRSRVEWALRQGTAAAVSSAIVLTANIERHFPFAVLIPILGVLMVQQTLGGTLAACTGIVRAGVYAVLAALCFFAPTQTPGDGGYWVTVAVTCPLLHVCAGSVTEKRVVLAFGSVFLWVWWKGDESWYFPVRFLATLGMACVAGLVALVVPRPRTACSLARTHLGNCKTLCGRVFTELASSVSHKSDYEHIAAQAELHMEYLRATLPRLEQAVAEAAWEVQAARCVFTVFAAVTVVPAFVLDAEFPSNRVLATLADGLNTVRDLFSCLESLRTIVSGMNEKRVHDQQFHLIQTEFIRVEVLRLAQDADMLLSQDGDLSTPDNIVASLRDLAARLTVWRSRLFCKETRPFSPEHGTHIKAFVFHAKRFANVLIRDATGYEEGGEGSEGGAAGNKPEGFHPYRALLWGPCAALREEVLQVVSRFRDLTWPKLRESLKITAAIMLSTGWSLWADMKPSFWCPLTVAFISAPNTSGSANAAMNRVQGTVFGGMFAYLVMRAWNPSDFLIGLLFSAWVILGGYIRGGSVKYSYAGVVTFLTAGIIMFGYDTGTGKSTTGHESLELLAFHRIQQTIMAAVVYLIVVFSIAPVRPSMQLVEQFEGWLVEFRECYAHLLTGYLEEDCGNACVEENNIQDLWSNLKQQRLLAEDVVDEPQLWHPEFPLECMNRMLGAAAALTSSLHEVQRSCSQLKGHHFKERAGISSIHPHLLSLRDITVTLFKHLSAVMTRPGDFASTALTTAARAIEHQKTALLDAFHQMLSEHIAAHSAPVLSNDEAESIHCFFQGLYTLSTALSALTSALRAYKLKEYASIFGY